MKEAPSNSMSPDGILMEMSPPKVDVNLNHKVLMDPGPLSPQSPSPLDNHSLKRRSTGLSAFNDYVDLVKRHLMYAVREEVEILKQQIGELMERIGQLEYENTVLRAEALPETISKLLTAQRTQTSATQQQPPQVNATSTGQQGQGQGQPQSTQPSGPATNVTGQATPQTNLNQIQPNQQNTPPQQQQNQQTQQLSNQNQPQQQQQQQQQPATATGKISQNANNHLAQTSQTTSASATPATTSAPPPSQLLAS